MANLDIRNLTRRTAPRAPFARIANAALPGWELSLAFTGPARAKALNQKLRRKSYVPNVLSYQSGNASGEIIICLEAAKKQAPDYGMTYQEFVGYLFIHALMHLKGYPHGSTMERQERRLSSRFLLVHPFNEKTAHRNRHRHRNAPDQAGRRRGG